MLDRVGEKTSPPDRFRLRRGEAAAGSVGRADERRPTRLSSPGCCQPASARPRTFTHHRLRAKPLPQIAAAAGLGRIAVAAGRDDHENGGAPRARRPPRSGAMLSDQGLTRMGVSASPPPAAGRAAAGAGCGRWRYEPNACAYTQVNWRRGGRSVPSSRPITTVRSTTRRRQTPMRPGSADINADQRLACGKEERRTAALIQTSRHCTETRGSAVINANAAVTTPKLSTKLIASRTIA